MKYLPLAALLLLAVPASAQPVTVPGLGTIDFPNSGSDAAQEPFIRGVLLLHSFEFGPAARAFRQAQEADPGFAMAYWGEAMANNYPLWRTKREDDARAVLARLAPSPEARRDKAGTEREARYLDAVEALFGDGDKRAQDLAYLDAMTTLHAAFPEDDEARAFLSLAILGSTNGERDFATYMRAAATAQPVFDRNPDHPGAAHYLIHSFDDPVHAPLGLPAADAYAEIAPEAAHAQHMTSHIFVAMGKWERVVTANIRAMDVQDAMRADSGQPPNACGHYSSWRHYGHLMLGQLPDAESLMDACHEQILSGDSGDWFYFVTMRARHVVDTEDWTLTSRWQAEPPREQTLSNPSSVYGGPYFTYMVTDALAELMQQDHSIAELLHGSDWGDYPGRRLQLKQLRGLWLIKEGQTDDGLALLEEAALEDAALPFAFGPPAIVKPGYELLARQLERAGRDAGEAWRQAGLHTPGRPLAQPMSTLGSN
ncbi:MAG: hypothetical protein JJ896_06425 [Rhodothermales bacterium]|nr:hypothetical protein [Rhodothermales bacterium]MBO6779270.1 hypothetical protein [Rhodothermales bacterium]